MTEKAGQADPRVAKRAKRALQLEDLLVLVFLAIFERRAERAEREARRLFKSEVGRFWREYCTNIKLLLNLKSLSSGK